LHEQPAWLTRAQAVVVLQALQETARHRSCVLLAAAVMANHVHIVVGVNGDPDPARLLADFKAYATRRLNQFERRTWWTESGSRRKLSDESAIRAAVRYVLRQPACMARQHDPASLALLGVHPEEAGD
jgi:REP element-mobilizing transposase RayT